MRSPALYALPLSVLGALSLVAQDTEPAPPPDEPTPAQASLPPVEELTRTIRPSCVVITQADRNGGTGGTGSGFVISEDGLIATCAHVIGEARPLTVRFDDGTEHEVKEIHAWDAKLDLAVLRIEATDLTPLPLAEDATLVQGADIVAMGAPQGLEFSVVRGVVSALREFDEIPLIQIAIPIEPGNSGGPLLDRRGRVHGLLAMKSAVTDNLGFAVPVAALHRMLEKPNPVPMEKWLTIGQLDPRRWTTLMGARWKQRAGRITVESPGSGFGGRSLCLSHLEVPEAPYEVTVEVLLDDEAGAAGLVFASDGGDRHYGFYPSGGGLRLTRFDGPDVYSWTILDQVRSEAYRPGEWNRLRVRVEDDTITGFVNGEKVVERQDDALRGGRCGLAKFRTTVATFRRFQVGADLAPEPTSPELLARVRKQVARLKREPGHAKTLSSLAKSPDLARTLLQQEAEELRELAERLDHQAQSLHRRAVTGELVSVLEGDAPDSLLHAALLLARLDNPELEVEAYLEEVARMASEIGDALPEEATPARRIEALSTYLFRDNGYHGSRSDYYNRSNSYLNEVIDDREGIPITLSLLFIELGRRIGVDLDGLGLPGHFVVCYRQDNQRMIVDPFEGGTPMSLEDADALLRAAGYPTNASEFPVAHRGEIISRMLRNLKGIAIEERDFRCARDYVDVLLAIDPDDAQERLSRALLHLQLEEAEAARPDLQWLLDNEPPDIHLGRVRELLQRL